MSERKRRLPHTRAYTHSHTRTHLHTFIQRSNSQQRRNKTVAATVKKSKLPARWKRADPSHPRTYMPLPTSLARACIRIT